MFYIFCASLLPFHSIARQFSCELIYSDTLQSVAGCDSISTIDLRVSAVLRDSVVVSICASQLPYTWSGRQLISAGIYSDTLQSVAGCDSISTIDLRVSAVLRDSVVVSICASQLPYTWSGRQLISAGISYDTLYSAAGCDSISTIDLRVSAVLRDSVVVSICASQLPYTWSGRQLISAGSESDA